MSDYDRVSPYLRQPIDHNYRDFLQRRISRLEAERRRLGDELALLREELRHAADTDDLASPAAQRVMSRRIA